MRWQTLFNKLKERHEDLSRRDETLIIDAISLFKEDRDDEPLKNLAKEIYIHDSRLNTSWEVMARDSIEAAEAFMNAWDNRKEESIEDTQHQHYQHYYVIKNGRTVSDYDDKKDAMNHAKRIDGTVSVSD